MLKLLHFLVELKEWEVPSKLKVEHLHLERSLKASLEAGRRQLRLLQEAPLSLAASRRLLRRLRWAVEASSDSAVLKSRKRRRLAVSLAIQVQLRPKMLHSRIRDSEESHRRADRAKACLRWAKAQEDARQSLSAAHV